MSRVFDECKAVLDKGASFRSPHFVLTEHTLVNESTVWVGECVCSLCSPWIQLARPDTHKILLHDVTL